MQWAAGSEAGFTTSSKPWLPIPPSATTYNVETESHDPNSIFNTYERLLSLRKSEPALRDGSYESVNKEDRDVFAFLRKTESSTIVVALNMSAQAKTIAIKGAGNSTARTLYSSASTTDGTVHLDSITLEPFGVLVARAK